MTASDARWEPGDAVTMRETLEGRVWAARPMRVVRDDPDLLAFYIPSGTRWKRPVGTRPAIGATRDDGWALVDAEWSGHGALHVVPPGRAHAWVAFWHGADRRFDHWYVNFQRSLTRTRIGFDYLDQIIDLIVAPDLGGWRWKDRDDFDAAEKLGLISRDEAEAVRREAEDVVDMIRRRKLPFDHDAWARWQPSREWTPPTLARGWEDVS